MFQKGFWVQLLRRQYSISIFRTFVILLAMFTSAAAWAQAPVASAPFRISYNGWFTVSVMVNGQGPFDFIIDSGATQTLLFAEIATQLEVPPTGGPDQTVLGLESAGAFPPHLIEQIDVAGVTIDNLTTVILPDWQVQQRPDGILGLDFLSQYICVFDGDNGMIHFYAPDATPPQLENWRAVDMIADDFGLDAGELYTVEARVNSRQFRFMVDLGASGTLVNKKAAEKIVAASNSMNVNSVAGSRLTVTDALEKTLAAKAMIARRFQLGRKYWYRQYLSVRDAAIFDELGVQNEPFGLFGADLVREQNFALDFPNEKFWMGKKVKRRNRSG